MNDNEKITWWDMWILSIISTLYCQIFYLSQFTEKKPGTYDVNLDHWKHWGGEDI